MTSGAADADWLCLAGAAQAALTAMTPAPAPSMTALQGSGTCLADSFSSSLGVGDFNAEDTSLDTYFDSELALPARVWGCSRPLLA